MGEREEVVAVAAWRDRRCFRLPGCFVAAAAAGHIYSGLLVIPLVDVLLFHRASHIAAAG